MNFSNSGQLSAEEYNKVHELSTKLTKKGLPAMRQLVVDAPVAQWSVYRNGLANELKMMMGGLENESEEPAAKELVALINDWCPSAKFND